jgi:hypothetical protein
VFSQTLPRGSLVQPYGMREGWIRVATPGGLSGWTYARSLRETVSLWGIPAVEMAEPQALADINGDGVKDLGLGAADLLDGKGLIVVRPPDRKYGWLTGFFKHRWVELRADTLWLRGVGADSVPKALSTARKTKRGYCTPGTCFYFVAMPGPSDSLAYVSAVGERGAVWTSPISVSKSYAVGVHQIDSIVVVLQEKGMWLLSAADGALRGQVATRIYLKSWRGVFFNRSGYTMAKGDSIIFRNYAGSESAFVALPRSDVKFFPPFAASLESDVWGVGNFGQPLWPVESEAVPVIRYVHRYDGQRSYYDVTVHLMSLRDGRELAAIPVSENSADCRYDEHGVYVSDDGGFRAVTWEGKPLAVADLPLLSYPIWDGDRIVSYYSRPMGTMFEAKTASRLSDELAAARRKWRP